MPPERLATALEQGVAPLYLLAGDEPLLLQEAADAVRRAARAAGYEERIVFEVDAGFDWQALASAGQELSLFARRRLFDLRLPDGKPGRDGAAALTAYAEAPPADTCLLISSGRLDSGQRRSRWFKALERAGQVVLFWPMEPSRLPAWVAQRMRQAGLRADPEACELLAERVEGNLLACAQEIEKIVVLKGRGARIGAEEIVELVADNARFDVFTLVDAALAADLARLPRVLDGLCEEGVPEMLVLWALQREVHGLLAMLREVEAGRSIEAVVAARRIWPRSRQPLVTQALERLCGSDPWHLIEQAARVDRTIKGRGAGNAWDELLQLALLLAGADLFGLRRDESKYR